MLADHFTRPLQGELFRKLRAELMNIPEDVEIDDMGWDDEKGSNLEAP